MSNTQLRIISALVMAAIVALAIIGGRQTSLGLVGIIGLIVLDEFLANFLEISRKKISYLISIASFASVFVFINFIDFSLPIADGLNNISIFTGLALLGYLFFSATGKYPRKILQRFPYLITAYLFLAFMNLAYLIHLSHWYYYLIVLTLLTFSMDTGAWFFGKKFGKHKLWPAVSPKKTIEGTAGGLMTSLILSSLVWYSLFSSLKVSHLIFFIILAAFAQLGDLVQSKMKRQFDLKDSSNLIPGHGGMYDRVDALLFVAPFFVLMIRSI